MILRSRLRLVLLSLAILLVLLLHQLVNLSALLQTQDDPSLRPRVEDRGWRPDPNSRPRAHGRVPPTHEPRPAGIVADASVTTPTPERSKKDVSQEGLEEQGWKAKVPLDKINLDVPAGHVVMHVIAHTHCDPGWLQTFEDYYRTSVKFILDGLVPTLEGDEKRKFNWVEICYFERWWRDQDTNIHERIRELWRKGQFEFVMGGWVSNDEACVNYMQAINQLSEGHRWLEENVFRGETKQGSAANNIARVGWQIDPFGLSEGMSQVFALSGFEANAGWRISEPEAKQMMKDQRLEFVWRSSKNAGEPSDVLMHIMPWSYTCPGDFLFEANGMGINNDQGKIEQLARRLVSEAKGRATYTLHKRHVMWLWGHDFHFKQANVMFSTMDRLLAYINSHSELGVTVQYSTPSVYFEAVHASNTKFPLISKDFLPYQAGPVNWWTGYFTSRPHLKRTLRVVDNLLRAAEQSVLLAMLSESSAKADRGADTDFSFRLGSSVMQQLELARRYNAVLQHHDAITGTMRRVVLQDYYSMAHEAQALCKSVLESMVGSAVGGQLTKLDPNLPSTVSSAPSSPLRKGRHTLVVYNSLAHWVHRIVQVEVTAEWCGAAVRQVCDGQCPNDTTHDASKPGGRLVASEIFPRTAFSRQGGTETLSFIGGDGTKLLLFQASLAPLGMHTFQLEPQETSNHKIEYLSPLSQVNGFDVKWLEKASSSERIISNEELQVTFDSEGRVTKIQRNDRGSGKIRQWNVSHEFMTYSSDSNWGNQYTFRSIQDAAAVPVDRSTPTRWVIVKGKLRSEMHVIEAEGIGNIARRYRLSSGVADSDFLETIDDVELQMGGPALDWISRWRVTDWSRKARLYSDPSGLLRIERPHETSRIISGNYFPSVYASELRSEDSGVGEEEVLLSACDTPEGVASPFTGTLERMIHRIAKQSQGNGETMDEGGIASITSRILLGSLAHVSARRLAVSMELNFSPIVLATQSPNDDLSSFRAAANSLPTPLFLVSLGMHNASHSVIRVGHLDEESSDVEFDLRTLIAPEVASIKQLHERTVTLMLPVDSPRRHWHWQDESTHEERAAKMFFLGDDAIAKTWKPTNIRSFFVDWMHAKK